MWQTTESTSDFQPNLFLPGQSWSTGEFSDLFFLGLLGLEVGDQEVRSQGEDKVTDRVEALGQRRAAESDPPQH